MVSESISGMRSGYRISQDLLDDDFLAATDPWRLNKSTGTQAMRRKQATSEDLLATTGWRLPLEVWIRAGQNPDFPQYLELFLSGDHTSEYCPRCNITRWEARLIFGERGIPKPGTKKFVQAQLTGRIVLDD